MISPLAGCLSMGLSSSVLLRAAMGFSRVRQGYWRLGRFCVILLDGLGGPESKGLGLALNADT